MPRESSGRHAFLVAAGILCSRLVGLVRQRVFSHYFGLSDIADAFSSALRVPNFLQNLFGEGVLSASFIPVYARLMAQGKQQEADRVAGAIAAMLALGISLIVLVGILATPWLIWAIAPGYTGEKRELTILLVRILFPGIGLLVGSAWCLGILNSHGKFFLSYSAPVIWNVSMIAAMVAFRNAGLPSLAVWLAWGTTLGCLLQFAIQVPPVLRLTGQLPLRLEGGNTNVREVFRNFGAVAVSRGVGQISSYVDQAISTLLGPGAMAAMTTAASINMLPVSLFGMAISASELPAMARSLGGSDTADALPALRQRLDRGMRRIAFFVVPSAMAFFALGDVITAALFQSGRFTHGDALFVWGILAGSGIGLLASTLGRLYSSTYYALLDPRTPLRYAMVRLLLTTVLGLFCALVLPSLLGVAPQWGTIGLTASAGLAGWIELFLLRRGMNRRIGVTGLPRSLLLTLWTAAAVAAAAAYALKIALGLQHPVLLGAAVLGVYGCLYFAITYMAGIPECRTLVQGFARRLKR
ncbi:MULTISPECIES: murein biosynthesis integral membrane protein MurJ [unclassified Achromobacter]|uniref:murein biosynthesis integral membrane protein MurJ n=1 Tax=unclassified Achromobacter TaxID=2626865 RepID=UPI0018E936DC|nr:MULTISPECIES: murein biosynthesis integral membrane protein MurJ [unclassified Achromobacter]